MKKIISLILCLGMIALCGCSSTKEIIKNVEKPIFIPISDLSGQNENFYRNETGVAMGDPFVYYEESDKTFYLYGTTRKNPDGSFTDDFKYYTSKDMKNWEYGGVCFTPTKSDWSHDRLWAPEMHKVGDKYYLYYTAAKQGGAMLHGSVAVANSPRGPFSNKIADDVDGSKPVFDFGFPSIDGSLFVDDDDSMFYYFAKDQVNGKSTIWGVLLDTPYSFSGEPVQLTDVGYSEVGETGSYTQPWEVAQNGVLWNEGPFMLKKDGQYYLTYSANNFGTKYYAVGVATSEYPLEGFIKGENAQIMGVELNNDKDKEWDYFSGSGHHMFFSANNENFIVYHKHLRAGDTSQRIMAFDTYGFRADGTLFVNGPTVTAQPLPSVVTNHKNIIESAEIKTTNGAESTKEYLTDGAFGVYSKYSDLEFSAKSGKTTIEIVFAEKQDISAVIVYNSADIEFAFNKVDSITFDDTLTANNIFVSSSINYYKNYVQAGSSAAIATSLSAKKITITINSDKPIHISEIKVL